MGHDTADGACGSGRGRHDVDGGGSGATQIPVGSVDEHLIAGVGVNGVEQPGFDAEGIVERLDDGGHAVRGARGIRDDGVRGRVERFLVHPHDEGRVDVLSGAESTTVCTVPPRWAAA